MEAFYQNWLKNFAEKTKALGHGDDTSTASPSTSSASPNNDLKDPTEIVFESDDWKLIVEKSSFKRQKIFKLQDHLFKFKIVQKKPNSSPTQMSDLFDFLHAALTHALESIKSFYNPGDHNIAYLTLHQEPMVNGLNTGKLLYGFKNH